MFDEAQYIRNSETFLHQGVRFFCDNANAVIFLSATPVQLGSDDLYTLLNVVRVGQVHLFYRATLRDTDFAPGPETIECKLFREEDVPWEELAFPSVRDGLLDFTREPPR